MIDDALGEMGVEGEGRSQTHKGKSGNASRDRESPRVFSRCVGEDSRILSTDLTTLSSSSSLFPPSATFPPTPILLLLFTPLALTSWAGYESPRPPLTVGYSAAIGIFCGLAGLALLFLVYYCYRRRIVWLHDHNPYGAKT